MTTTTPPAAFARSVSTASTQPGSEPPRPPVPVLVRVTAEQARSLDRAIPVLVRNARRQLDDEPQGRAVVLDLSAVPPMPACAPLLFLIALLRRAGGPTSRITAIGVSPALASCLIADLPDGVDVVDRNGRRWSG